MKNKIYILFCLVTSFISFGVRAQTIDTIADYSGISGFSGDGGQATAAQLYGPNGITLDATGNIYVSDKGNNRIRKINTAGVITTIAGSDITDYTGDGGPATTAGLSNPQGIMFDAAGNMYINDVSHGVIRKVSTAGTTSTVAGDYYNFGTSNGNGGPAINAGIGNAGIYCFAIDDTGNIILSDGGLLRKVEASTGIIDDYNPTVQTQIGNANNIIFDAQGNLYVVNTNAGRIYKVTPSGTVTAVAGGGTYPNAGNGGPATAAYLDGPNGIAIDAAGNIYITEAFDNAVRKINTAGIISLISNILQPDALATDPNGDVYATSANSILKFIVPSCSSVTAGNIISSAGNTFCTPVITTLTMAGASVNNGGGVFSSTVTGITYQWQSSTDGITWANVGSDSTSYTTGTIAATTYYRGIATCTVSGLADTTAIDTLNFASTAPPSVSITVTGDTICAGSSATFTATSLNGGSNPTYQWYKNGMPIATTATYSDNSFANNDSIVCVMTSSLSCASPTTATSNSIKLTVNPLVTPTISISVSPGDSICGNSAGIGTATFTATITNGGSNPTYNWQYASGFLSTNTTVPVWTTNLGFSDAAVCILTSNAGCVTAATATSNTINMYIAGPGQPITISAFPSNTVDSNSGTVVTFTAAPTYPGAGPISPNATYQWRKNGTIISGATNATYATSSFNNNDEITCALGNNVVGNYTCTLPVISNTITMVVVPGSYCIPYTVHDCSLGDYFSYFKTTGGITNFDDATGCQSASSAPGNGYYYDGTDTVTAAQGSTINLTFEHNPNTSSIVNPDRYEIWIDWNHDDVFEPGENVYNSTLLTGQVATVPVQVPASAIVGTTRIRVSCGSDINGLTTNFSSAPCDTIHYGICKDYTFVVATPQCFGTPTAGAVTSSGGNSFCGSGNSTLTLAGSTAGAGTTYQWQSSANGTTWTNVGSDANSYATGSITNTIYYRGIVGCTTSGYADTSAVDTFSLVTSAIPSVTIALSTGDTICAGTAVTFTAMPLNGGNTPTFQWLKNGTAVGTGITYTDNGLANGDSISCTMTGSLSCANPATATGYVIMTVNPIVTPTVSISVSPGDTLCPNPNGGSASGVFTATVTNGGSNPTYSWGNNGFGAWTWYGSAQGDNMPVVTLSIQGTEQVVCKVTSNAACATSASASSDTIGMYVYPTANPSTNVGLSATVASVTYTSVFPGITVVDTAGNTVTFTATADSTNGTTYQWTDNGINISGATNSVFSSDTLNNGDHISCTVSNYLVADHASCGTTTASPDFPITMSIFTPGVYCTPLSDAGGCAYNDDLVYFTTTGGILNFNDITACQGTVPDSGYVFDSTDTVSAIIGDSVTFTFEADPNGYGDGDAIWIDWNHDEIFEPDESVYNNFINAGDTGTVTVTVPLSATIGATRMRVTCGYDENYNNPTDPCGELSEGVSKDYVFIIGTLQCSGTPVAGTIMNSGNNSFCGSGSDTLTLTGATASGNGITYQWQSSVDNTTWTNAGTDTTVYATGILNSTTYYRNIVACGASGLSDTTVTDTITITPVVIPAVSISANPGTSISSGQSVVFTTTIANGGSNPAYQWQKNGVNIPSATLSTYTSNTLANNDTITCIITSNAACADPDSAASTPLIMAVSSGVASIIAGNNEIQLYPDPNNGTFDIVGAIHDSKEAQIEVLDVVGRVVYSAKVPVRNGQVHEQIELSATDASGIYIMHIKTDNGSSVLRFVMER